MYGTVPDWITAAATLALAVVVSYQLTIIARQIRTAREAEEAARRRMWELETLKACQAYDFDGVIDAATARIAKAAGLGKDYKSPNVSQRDVICVLNYLDGLAIGIEQKLYIEQIVRDHLGPVIDHAVTNFLDTAVVERHYYPHLTNVHGRWFRGAQSPNYKAPAPK